MAHRFRQPPRTTPFRLWRHVGLAVLGMGIARVLLPTTAAAQSPTPGDATEAPAEGSFAAELEEAKALYFQGDLDQSLLVFQGLQLRYAQAPEVVPFDEAVEALTYLGEILVKRGDDDEASRVFRTILEQDLEVRISPYHHPADVVFVFNRVREQIAAERAAEVPEELVIPPAPATSYLPLGLPQFARGRVGPGVLYGGGQVLLGSVAVGTYLHLRVVNRPTAGHPLGWTDEQVVRRTQSRRYGVQWPATIGFYALWMASAVEARGAWRRTHQDEGRARVVPMILPPDQPNGSPVVGLFWGARPRAVSAQPASDPSPTHP